MTCTVIPPRPWLAGPQFFALVHVSDPNRVCYFGGDVGDGAFTVRRDPTTGHTTMNPALRRLLGELALINRQVLVIALDMLSEQLPPDAQAAFGARLVRLVCYWMGHYPPMKKYAVTADPEGNEFCVAFRVSAARSRQVPEMCGASKAPPHHDLRDPRDDRAGVPEVRG